MIAEQFPSTWQVVASRIYPVLGQNRGTSQTLTSAMIELHRTKDYICSEGGQYIDQVITQQ